jgi:hypothetical protein
MQDNLIRELHSLQDAMGKPKYPGNDHIILRDVSANGFVFPGIWRASDISLFIKGPVPVWWLALASTLSWRAAKLAPVLWLLAGLNSDHRVVLRTRFALMFGLSRYAVKRALMDLEKAGLVKAVHVRGRKPAVTLVMNPVVAFAISKNKTQNPVGSPAKISQSGRSEGHPLS